MKIELGEICSCDPAGFLDADSSRQIGLSREGRPLHAATLGSGPLKISLLAGAHADEPVGPRTLAELASCVKACSIALSGAEGRWLNLEDADPRS